MTYDHWKTTNPADEFLGPEPETDMPKSKLQQLRENATWQDFCRVQSRLDVLVDGLRRMGENDMGLLTAALAGKFHRATAMLTDVNDCLQRAIAEGEQRVQQ
jgi:hypothetical protein